ncbi:MAG: DUF2007 domain-containing protein [Bacteroidota bacterium]|nr:MAG: DUF2007 domain-containing protein [Bacteroidota bacterium]
MSDEWTLVYSSQFRYHAELVRHMLEDNLITAVIMDKQDSNYGIGNIEVYVRPSEALRARHLISKTEF